MAGRAGGPLGHLEHLSSTVGSRSRRLRAGFGPPLWLCVWPARLYSCSQLPAFPVSDPGTISPKFSGPKPRAILMPSSLPPHPPPISPAISYIIWYLPTPLPPWLPCGPSPCHLSPGLCHSLLTSLQGPPSPPSHLSPFSPNPLRWHHNWHKVPKAGTQALLASRPHVPLPSTGSMGTCHAACPLPTERAKPVPSSSLSSAAPSAWSAFPHLMTGYLSALKLPPPP